jgi:hypothetical protein
MAYMRQGGLGSYDHTGDWSWEFYPPPYDFLAPANAAAMPAPILLTPGGGLSGAGCGCGGSCGGCGGHSHGMGLFESGFDWTQWGAGEWTVAGVGSYLAVSLMGDMMRAKQTVQRKFRRRRS